MSVLVEAISVIVPRVVLEAKYPGGTAQYQRDCPNRTYCADEHLTRIGFMAPADVQEFVSALEKVGLVHQRDGQALDLVVVDQRRGPTTPCRWVEAGRHPDGYSAAWLAGTIPGWFAHPKGWTVQNSKQLELSTTEEAEQRFLRIAREKNVETLLDYFTGKQMYMGRTNSANND
jgi:hypothetical protein